MTTDLFAGGEVRRGDCRRCGFPRDSFIGCRCRQPELEPLGSYTCNRCYNPCVDEPIFGAVVGVRHPFCSIRCLTAARRAVRGKRRAVGR